MSGNYLLDTNAVVALLKGDKSIACLIENAEWIGVSVISYIEFLVFPDLSNDDKSLFDSFVERVEVVPIYKSNTEMIDFIIHFRQNYKVKLPDAIILAAAFIKKAKLVSADKQLLSIKEIEIVNF